MENQEKHKEIYKLTGVEPRYWRGYVYVGIAQVDMEYFLTEYQDEVQEPKPHYPCEQLWEMLRPLVDIVSWDMYFIVLQYRKNNQGGLKQIQFSVKDLHTALLDCVLWCIEENYIPTKEGK
jgi:hypothetical protein